LYLYLQINNYSSRYS